MRTGYNKELADKAQNVLLVEASPILKQQFDSQGNIIRDYIQEIAYLSEQDITQVLPAVDISYFDSCKRFETHKKQNDISPVVRRIKLAQIPIQRKSKSVLYYTVQIINYIYSMINRSIPKDSPTINHKGWAFTYIFINKKRKR